MLHFFRWKMLRPGNSRWNDTDSSQLRGGRRRGLQLYTGRIHAQPNHQKMCLQHHHPNGWLEWHSTSVWRYGMVAKEWKKTKKRMCKSKRKWASNVGKKNEDSQRVKTQSFFIGHNQKMYKFSVSVCMFWILHRWWATTAWSLMLSSLLCVWR